MADGECREKPKFRLFLSNNEVFVWDKDVILTLREKYRIVGSLIGSLPSKPRQNSLFSVPLVLQAEEVTLLVEKNLAKVVVGSSTPPSNDTVTCFQNERQANIEEQIEKLKEIKKDKLEEFAEVIEEGRVKKGRRGQYYSKRKHSVHSDSEEDHKKKPRSGESNEHGQTGISGTQMHSDSKDDNTKKPQCGEGSGNDKTDKVKSTSSPNKLDIIKQDINSIDITDTQDNYKDSTLIHVSSHQPTSLQTTMQANWRFPENDQDVLRYKVFLDLWGKGYYITQGSKFGGDYLVYPSDPFRFHSYFVVTVIPWAKKLSPLELVSMSRLGSTVKKTSVFASVDCGGNVIYTSIQWPGF